MRIFTIKGRRCWGLRVGHPHTNGSFMMNLPSPGGECQPKSDKPKDSVRKVSAR
jgi:hypothetical protein